MGDGKTESGESTVLGLRDAAPVDDDLDRAVGRARVAAALFGDVAPIKVGRYALIERAGAGGMGVVWSAYDAELERPVALKLATAGDEATRARAQLEGRALAKLSHPNVVPIYDVVDAEQGVFLVMELVKGRTLRAVAAERSTASLELVRAYRQAGEGLAAAHAAGLIHRDFKPDNAILGADGRVRVLDFGLASTASTSTEIAGTPRYMAPEQKAGKPLTPAVDQYALAVSLRESLPALPRWLEPILARATAEDPAARYPAMHDLLRALALDPATRWRRRAAVGAGVIALGAIAVAFTLGRANREVSPCEGGPALIAATWNPAAVAARLDALVAPYSVAWRAHVRERLADYANEWQRIHRASCEAHQRGEISADLLDRRAGCLAGRRSALATLGELASHVDDAGFPALAIAIEERPNLASCEDDETLVASVPPPARALATEATAITELLARADVERDAGKHDDAARDAASALQRARSLAYRPLVARALHTRGRVALASFAEDRGEPLFRESVLEAIASGDEPLAIEAYARHAFAVATTQGPKNARVGLPLIEALILHAGERAKFSRTLLHMNLASIELADGNRKQARVLFERVATEAVTITGAGADEVTMGFEGLLALAEDEPERARFAAELVNRRAQLLGTLHPRTFAAKVFSAMTIADADRARVELWSTCREFANPYPNDPIVAECSYEVMWLAAMAGDPATSRAAAAILRSTQSEASTLADAATGFLRLADGDRAGARRTFANIQSFEAKQPTSWWHDFYIADAAAAESLVAATATDASRSLAKAKAYYARIQDALPFAMRTRRATVIGARR